jgi:hypothetical protein
LYIILFYVLVWQVHHFVIKLRNEANLLARQRLWFNVHLTAFITINMGATVTWLWTRTMMIRVPWFLYVLAATSVLLVAHYSFNNLKMKKFWLLVQLYVFYIVAATMFAHWYIFDRFEPNIYRPWPLWAIGGWAALIALQALGIGSYNIALKLFRAKHKRRRASSASASEEAQPLAAALYAHDVAPTSEDVLTAPNLPIVITKGSRRRPESLPGSLRHTKEALGYVSNTPQDHPYYVEHVETPSKVSPHSPLLASSASDDDNDVEVHDDFEDSEVRHLSSSSITTRAGASSSDIEVADAAASAGDVYIDVYTSGSPVLGRMSSVGWSLRKQNV